jgi:GNAT superfamily N-acetyltransferase
MEAELIIRPARSGDSAAMKRICAHTWDWGDYIPDAWETWLADEECVVLVGEIEGQVVALSNAAFQPDGQVWLEGMRVDPDHRRQGIAGQFLDSSIALARDRGARVVRLGTGRNNAAVQTIAARAGMKRIGTYVQWNSNPLDGTSDLVVLSPDSAAQVHAFLKDSPVLAHNHGLYSADWAWQELSPERVAHFLAGGQGVAQLAPGGSLAALAFLVPEPEDQALWVGFADGEPEAVPRLLTALRSHAAQAGAEKVRTMVPAVAWLRDAFQAAGFTYGDWQGELCIFERWLRASSSGGPERVVGP